MEMASGREHLGRNESFLSLPQKARHDRRLKAVQIEATNYPPIYAPAALYTKEHTTLQGTSAYVEGMDHCGTFNVPGVLTMADVNQNGHPTITGAPSAIVEHSPKNIDVQKLIDQFKVKANYNYNVNSATMTGMDWGTPNPGATQQDASSCNSHNVVHFNTNSTYVNLTGGVPWLRNAAGRRGPCG